MSDSNYHIRVLSSVEEVRLHHIRRAIEEEWNPVDYSSIYFPQDPHGFFIGELNGAPVSCISAVKYGDFSFLGFYVVDPKFRGKGYGKELFEKALEYALVGTEVVGLDAVFEQIHNYEKNGFKCTWTNTKYLFNPKKVVELHPLQSNLSFLISPANTVSFEALKEYDFIHFGAPRDVILRHIVEKEISYVATENGKIVGLCASNPLTEKGKMQIGPLFANSPLIAECLLLTLCQKVLSQGFEGIFYYLCPHPNEESVNLAKKFQMEVVFECKRMYREKEGKKHHFTLQNVYSFTSFEFD